MVSQNALQVVSQHALQVSRRRSPDPHPGRKLRKFSWGRVSRPTPGGSPGPHQGVSRSTPGGCILACTEADPPQLTATAAGGTHPTGIHSCFLVIFLLWRLFFFQDTINCNLFATVYIQQEHMSEKATTKILNYIRSARQT